jgi:ABC-type nitrate/sulfonate/bicarbonate transport system ATPase subunit
MQETDGVSGDSKENCEVHMEILKVEDVSKRYRIGESEIKALEKVSFNVKEGEFICILGPSGCGKTTLLNIIAGLTEPDSGHVEFSLSSRGDIKTKISYVFQQHRLLPWKTTEENLYFVLKANNVVDNKRRETVDKYIKMVGMEDKRKSYPFHLSEGQRQRVSIARALSIKPDLILMDEPLSHLDELTARGLRKEIIEIWRSEKKTIIYVTHNALEAAYLADRIFIISKSPGEIIDSITVNIPHPRVPESGELFEIQKRIISIMQGQGILK